MKVGGINRHNSKNKKQADKQLVIHTSHLHHCLSACFSFLLSHLCLFLPPTFTPSPFPDDDTHMSVETLDQSQSWLEFPKIY